MTTLDVLHWMAGLIVLAEALNKLERVDLLDGPATVRERWADGLKALAWGLLALGAGGAVVAPLLPSVGLARPTLGEAMVMLGFAVLIVRTRVKEG